LRVWDIHPGYLSGQSLLGQHAEIHALYAVIVGKKKGYASHPETLRWKEYPGLLKKAHELTVREMALRSFKHASPLDEGPDPVVGSAGYVDTPVDQFSILQRKYCQKNSRGRIPLPKNIYEYWAHHKYSVMARGYNHYREIQSVLGSEEQCSLPETAYLIEKVAAVMQMPVTVPALANVIDHLWGYFKQEASEVEKKIYLERSHEQMDLLLHNFFELAVKYNCRYLLHSTIFADFTALP